MGDSVGQVSLDLLLNSKEFEDKLNNAVNKATNNINGKMNKSLSKTGNLLGKIGKIAAGAFAVTKLVQFGKECVNLGSDLAEVQNVVDSTFGSMSSKIDEWASHSIESMGMSEASAKKYAGTFGAMAKSFGFTGDEMVNMSEQITQLTADTASFYNLSYDEAYTKMKSIFTGETESLKDLGVVMTQTALDSYAMANGFGKTTSQMTEQEKVALRYKFVMDKLSTASGDFQRTSGGWANQTRMLAENFNKLKASIGQGLINVLLPVIRVINSLMAKLQVLGEMFSNFTAKIFGKAETSASTISSSISDSLGGIEETASGTSDAIGNVADSTSEAAKKISKTTFGFDELNTLQAPDDSSGTGGAGDVGGGGLGDTLTTTTSQQEALNNKTSVYEKILDRIIKKVKELKDLFISGFKNGLDTTNINKSFDNIKNSINSIKESFKNIFGDGQIISSLNSLVDNIVYTLGSIVGDVVGVAASIGSALIGGIAQYLDENAGFLKEKFLGFIREFNESVDIIREIFDNVSQILADTFNSSEVQRLVSECIAVIVNPFLELKLLFLEIWNDIMGGVSDFISRYKEEITSGLTATAGIIADIFDGAKTIILDIIDILRSSYESYVKPVLVNFGERMNELMDKYIIPLGNTFVECWNKIKENLAIVWEQWLKPFVKWFIEDLVKDIMKAIDDILEVVFIAVGRIAQFIDGMIQIISGIIYFLVGIFTGDWDKAWQGIKDIFSGFWEQIKSIVGFAIDILEILFGDFLSNIKTSWDNAWTSIKDFFINTFNTIKDTLSNLFNNISDFATKTWDKMTNCFNSIKDTISNFVETGKDKILDFKDKILGAWNSIKDGATSIFGGIRDFVSDIFGSLVNIIKTPMNAIIGIINKSIDGINGLNIDIPEWVPGVGGQTFGFSLPNIPALANGGYITAPTLAMVGEGQDNEIVAPEQKLREIRDEGTNSTNLLLQEMVEQNKQLINIMTMLLNKNTDLNIDGYQLATVLNNINASETRRRG